MSDLLGAAGWSCVSVGLILIFLVIVRINTPGPAVTRRPDYCNDPRCPEHGESH